MNEKNNIKNIINELVLNYNYITKFKKLDKINVIKGIESLLEEYKEDEIIYAIRNLSKKTKYVPNISEIKIEINKIKKDSEMITNYSSLNLNSSYWYANLKLICDKENKPYYDITTGKELPPFKYKE